MSYHFVTGDFTPQKVFLPDKEYGLALDALVKGCADVLLTRGEGAALRILLGKRKVEPQPDWWFVGGRTRPGDTPAEGAARNVKRELGLAIETRRLVHVNTYSFVWNYRQQAPTTNGTADASTVFELPLTQAEADGLGPSKFDEEGVRRRGLGRAPRHPGGGLPPGAPAGRARLVGAAGIPRFEERGGRPSGGRGAVRARFVAWKEAAPLRACKVRFVDGSYQFVGTDGARVPRPTKASPGLARPPLFALRDVAFYASIAAVAFMAGRRSWVRKGRPCYWYAYSSGAPYAS